ncbi:lytic murein transglycosylase [Promicromonospora sp. MEB111]|uniref:lytic transglycosylase domain-containing protein n=1 Tax=Promicromonospora sp. MEB111 TaxID=3040301 RepID=UPI00254C1F56|nr:lytic murein transglycosylase [Promicromonospora sp. MEB111]
MRARAGAVVCAAALLLAACSPGGRTWPEVLERDYPPAPAQRVPVSGENGGSGASGGDGSTVPVADLADPEWLRDTAERTGIPRRALAAYAGASLRLAETLPECGLGWNTLAGIGAVESIHGSYLGASTDADGLVSPPIIGIALDGSEGVMEILDTDEGELDGDVRWDRAVGPMQFIPTTWGDHAQDGNLDGRADPHQIDDAVLTAAHYLCESGGDVTTDDGWTAALGAYNRSVSYAHDVADLATSYGAEPDGAEPDGNAGPSA